MQKMEKIKKTRMFSNTNWNLYRSFLILYETKKYTEAEKILKLDRKCIRSNILTLQDQVGEVLFVSHSKGMTPTDAAHTIYPLIQKCIDGIVEAEQAIKKFDRDSSAVIKMVTSSTVVNYILVDYFKEFLEKYPNVSFEFYSRAQEENYHLLAQRKLDFVIYMDWVCEKYGLKTKKLFELSHIFIASKKFLKKHGLGLEISKEDAEKLTIIGEELPNLKKLGINPNRYIATSTSDAIYELVKENTGIGFYCDKLFAGIKDKDKSEIVEVKIKGFETLKYNFVCGHTGYLSRVSQIFVDGLIKFCQDAFA